MSNSSGPDHRDTSAASAVASSICTQAPKYTRSRIAPAPSGLRIDDGHALEPLAQEAHAPVDFVQALLAVGVLGVLRAIALRGGLGHRLRDARAFVVPELSSSSRSRLAPSGVMYLEPGGVGGRYLDTVQ